jgi:hypothetical protein
MVHTNLVTHRLTETDLVVLVHPRYLLTFGGTVRGLNPGGGEIFRTRPDRRDPPSLLYIGYRVFPGGKVAGAWR